MKKFLLFVIIAGGIALAFWKGDISYAIGSWLAVLLISVLVDMAMVSGSVAINAQHRIAYLQTNLFCAWVANICFWVLIAADSLCKLAHIEHPLENPTWMWIDIFIGLVMFACFLGALIRGWIYADANATFTAIDQRFAKNEEEYNRAKDHVTRTKTEQYKDRDGVARQIRYEVDQRGNKIAGTETDELDMIGLGVGGAGYERY